MSISDRPQSKLLLIYLVCVAFSALLWLLIMLDKRYTTEVPVRIEYKDIPVNKVSDIGLTKKLTVEISGRGFELIRDLLSIRKKFIVININDYINRSLQQNNFNVLLSEKDIKEKLGTFIPPDITILSTSPANIKLSFTDIAIKKVPVFLNADITTKKQYIVKNVISLQPDHVIISGPKNIIDTTRYIYTEKLNLPEVWQNTELEVGFIHNKDISISSESTRLGIEIEHSTGAKRKIRITTLNLPPGFSMNLFPETVDIEYEVGLSKYEESLAAEFILGVDFKETGKGNKYLEIRSVRIPKYIKNLTYSPHRAEYIIEQ